MRWTNVTIKSPSSTTMQPSSSTQSLDKHTQMLKFRNAPTGLRISFNSTWRMIVVHFYTHSRTQETTSGIRTKRSNSCIPKSFWWSRRYWNPHASTIIWILGQYPYQRCFKKSFAKMFRENSLSPAQQFMDQNNIPIMPRERIFMCTTWFPQATSKISLWTRLDQLLMS